MYNNITFASPTYFLLLLLLIPIVAWYWYNKRNINAHIQISTIDAVENNRKSFRHRLRTLPFILRILVYIFIVIVLARPQAINSGRNVTVEGIDIVMAMDISGSMLAQDFKPDRIEAAKQVASEFIEGRPNDRIGLVIFSSESFTQCPLTTDHTVLINLLRDVHMGMIQDGTAIGLGLATAVNRLKDSKAKSRVIILLTDGVNNAGSISPLTAADIAKTFGIRVYTIGVGTHGVAPYPVQTPYGIQYQNMNVEIDEAALTEIAKGTNGKYFRATNNQKLRDIYHEIDKLEKSKIQEYGFTKRKEEYLIFSMIAGILLLLDIILRNTYLRRIP
jgi:Ca-activated chloride channel homolog